VHRITYSAKPQVQIRLAFSERIFLVFTDIFFFNSIESGSETETAGKAPARMQGGGPCLSEGITSDTY